MEVQWGSEVFFIGFRKSKALPEAFNGFLAFQKYSELLGRT